MADRKSQIGIATLLVLCLGSIGLYLFARDSNSEDRIRELIQPAYNRQRPGGGRLSATPYTPVTTDSPKNDSNLGYAQVLLLNMPNSDPRAREQSRIYLAAGDWQNFIDSQDRLSPESRNQPSNLNDLGASFLAMSGKNPTYLLRAMDAFRRASTMDPKAQEPLFNLVITYRKLHFLKLADDTFKRYSALDKTSAWNRELANPAVIDEAAIRDELVAATDRGDLAEARRLFQDNPELCRRLVMAATTKNEPESPALLHFIANEMESRYGDKTMTAFVETLSGKQRESSIAIREYVLQGADLYARGNYTESLEAYAQADKIAGKTDSEIDKVWIDLNRADTQIRTGQLGAARESIARVVSGARQHQFTWLMARALSIYGYSMKLTDSYAEMLDLLSEADRIFASIDAPHDRVRVLYYLSYYKEGAGDEEAALGLGLQCLFLVSDNREAGRLSTLDWLIGSVLYRRGETDKAIMFAQESVEQGKQEPYAAVEAATATALAELYASISQNKLAEQYIQTAQEAFQKIPDNLDRRRGELSLDLVKANVQLNDKQFGDAETLLQKSLSVYSEQEQPFAATPVLTKALMLSARLYTETGRFPEAARKFNEAIDVVENDDDYLKTENARVKFDDQRRDLYDSAIEFEFTHGSLDSAWSDLQKYRAKLFLEFLAAFQPSMKQSRSRIVRAEVQQRIPKDTQIIEYTLLKDKLLIWLVTDKIFTVRYLDMSRATIEGKVEKVLQKLRRDEDADDALSDLGAILIGPVAPLLDPNRNIAIIPDRALHGLPFPALRVNNRYLIQDFPVIVSPSLTYLITTSSARPRRDNIIGFGSQGGGGPELKELDSLKEIYPHAQTFAGPSVNKAVFLGAMKNATILHYAGHSATDAADPLRSSILLDGNRSGPNSVTAVDISQQKLASNSIVILSSCDSSVGNSRDGIGVRGLTSAFLIGGAGAVVGSLWPVESTSTADLMIDFHTAFAKQGMPVAQALRQAQLSFLQSSSEKAHPYYWSGFVVTGNFSALR